MAMCYRVQARNPSIPTQRGCYFKHDTASRVCRGPVTSWTLDWWGTERWQGDTEAACLARKEGHDAACEVNSSWLFVPWSSEVPPATTRAVSEHLTWLVIKEILKSSGLPRCRRVPLSESPAVSWGTWSDDGRRRRGGRGSDDDRRLQSQAASYIAEYLSQRKVLVAPYTGEVKELIDMAVVEAILGAFEDDTSGQRQANLPGFLGLLTRCPLVQGALASTALESASEWQGLNSIKDMAQSLSCRTLARRQAAQKALEEFSIDGVAVTTLSSNIEQALKRLQADRKSVV